MEFVTGPDTTDRIVKCPDGHSTWLKADTPEAVAALRAEAAAYLATNPEGCPPEEDTNDPRQMD